MGFLDTPQQIESHFSRLREINGPPSHPDLWKYHNCFIQVKGLDYLTIAHLNTSLGIMLYYKLTHPHQSKNYSGPTHCSIVGFRLDDAEFKVIEPSIPRMFRAPYRGYFATDADGWKDPRVEQAVTFHSDSRQRSDGTWRMGRSYTRPGNPDFKSVKEASDFAQANGFKFYDFTDWDGTVNWLALIFGPYSKPNPDLLKAQKQFWAEMVAGREQG